MSAGATPERKLSAAASVVAQAKRKAEANKNVGQLVQTRIEHGLNPKTGQPTLKAVFPRGGGGSPHQVNLTFLLRFPNLQPMFEQAFLIYGATCMPYTRDTTAGTLQRGFFSFLDSAYAPDLQSQDIDDEVLLSFRAHLVGRQGKHGKPLHPNTVNRLLGVLRTVLGSLETGPWAGVASRIAERVPPGSAGASRKTNPTEVLGLDVLLQVMEAAEREVLVIQERFKFARQLIAEGRQKLLDPSRVLKGTRGDFGELPVALAALEAAYPTVIPDLLKLEADNKNLGSAVKEIHSHQKVSSYFYLTARELVPFALLLTISTVFNPDTVLSLDWPSINFDKDRAGTPAIEIIGGKGRAARDLVRLLDPEAAVSSALGLQQMLQCLKEITSRIRPSTEFAYAQRLFLFVQQSRAKEPKGWGSVDERHQSPSNDDTWKWSLKNFITDNKLPVFTLSQLRPTILDMVQSLDGSLEAAQRVGNHRSPVTTWKHYTSSGVKKRYQERIGQVLLLRGRWLETNGTIDPRKLMPGHDRGAATPGFLCLNPFGSPRPNQQEGKLCKDYGGCPACPMAGAYPNDPTSVCYYTALERAIYSSQPTMSAKTWLDRWAPVLADLKALLALVSAEVLEASRKVTINLPKVG